MSYVVVGPPEAEGGPAVSAQLALEWHLCGCGCRKETCAPGCPCRECQPGPGIDYGHRRRAVFRSYRRRMDELLRRGDTLSPAEAEELDQLLLWYLHGSGT